MFEGFDDMQAPDQWDEITARSEGPLRPGLEPKGHRAAIAVAVAAAMLGIAGIVWVGLGEDDDLATVGTPADTIPETTSPATAPPPTAPWTSAPMVTTDPPPATVAAEEPVLTAPPTTPPPYPPGSCTEIAGDANAIHASDLALNQFGPLGAAPVLDITTGWPEILSEGTDVVRVDGGVAVVLQTHFDQSPGWRLTVVNDDGTIRWRRCGSDTNVLGMFSAARFLVVSEIDPTVATYPPPASQHLLDVSSGADAGFLEIPPEMQALATSSNRYRLFGVPQPHNEQGVPQAGSPDAGLRVLDTTTMAMSDVPYPSDYYTGERYADWIELVETPESATGWILKQYADQYPIVSSVFVDDTWSNDPTVIRSTVPVVTFSSYGQGSPWTGVNALGEVLWTVPDKVAYWAEGPVSHEGGDIDLLIACDSYDFTEGAVCVSPGLLGVDGESGAVLWQLPGHRQVAAVADGYAVITDGTENIYAGTPPATWLMIDTATGEPIEGQGWSFETFETNPYSMEDEGMWIRRQGGVVLAVNGQHVRVYMPVGASSGTINVSLPS